LSRDRPSRFRTGRQGERCGGNSGEVFACGTRREDAPKQQARRAHVRAVPGTGGERGAPLGTNTGPRAAPRRRPRAGRGRPERAREGGRGRRRRTRRRGAGAGGTRAGGRGTNRGQQAGRSFQVLVGLALKQSANPPERSAKRKRRWGMTASKWARHSDGFKMGMAHSSHVGGGRRSEHMAGWLRRERPWYRSEHMARWIRRERPW